MTRYQRVRWSHDAPDLPVVLYSEVDDAGREVRKVDEYTDGHRDLASATIETGTTRLGEGRIPPLDEINLDPQFDGLEISAQEFETVWGEAQKWFDLP